jgi:hypothetical protein
LSTIFPAARYVHLIRDGRDVTQSLATVEWWNHHTVWWDGRTPLEMERAGEPRLAVCARNWLREVQELQLGLSRIDAAQILVLRFEELLSDPLRHLERVLSFLGVDFPAAYRDAIMALNLRPARAHWPTDWDAQQRACVLAEIQPTLQRLGYTS